MEEIDKADEEIYFKNLKKIQITRGAIIESCISLEMQLNVLLSAHYGKNKTIQDELFYQLFITNKITFDSKIELLDIAVKKHYPKFNKDNPTYLSSLKDIISHRNNFAHQHIDVSPNGKNIDFLDEIRLFKHDKRNNEKKEIYTENKIKDILNSCNKLKEAFIALASPLIAF